MDRKRRHESERSSAGPSSDNQSEGTIKKKPKVLDDCASSSEFDDYDFWLIKKPVSVSPESLSNLKFPSVGKEKKKSFASSSEENCVLRCQFVPANAQLLYVPTSHVRTQKEAMNMKAVAEIGGVCLISKFQSEASLSASGGSSCPIEINSIRKKPEPLVTKSRSQLKAFGVRHRKKKRKLCNLK
ncbi:unnamed protein product [Enterobius vermicularis]|uniref:Uncharacterized protein n=1 Tax=Enterobius vermicularis TaxID=51028 RepID=A0A0N4V4S6_ENTVE|nr:unnamed protein product [Enterobius vermicularis]